MIKNTSLLWANMVFSFPGVYPNQHIDLTFTPPFNPAPDFVLVYAFYQKQLLFTHHQSRGWELPGGKCNPGEWAIHTAIREVYEETGAELAALKPIGQYTLIYPNKVRQFKTIYLAQIETMHPYLQILKQMLFVGMNRRQALN